MNKRFKELAEQARKALATDAMSGGEFNMKAYEERFGELIVRECANFIKNTDPDPDIGEEDAQALLDHFGVK